MSSDARGSTLIAGPAAPPVGAHRLHAPDRDWDEVNCYVDLWIELLAWLGHDPVPALAATLSAGVDVDQWIFLKPEPEDLRRLYDVQVRELNVWRPVLDQVEIQLGAGRLMTVEVDAWFLPDTRGRAYQMQHDKTTIVPAWIDRGERRLGYFHGPGYYELDSADFDGLFAPAMLPPYAETAVLGAGALRGDALVEATVGLCREHLARAPHDPVRRLGDALLAQAEWLPSQEPAVFHALAFGTARQCGGTAELAADLAVWLADHAGVDTRPAAAELRSVSETAKALQFNLARVARGRRGDLAGPLGRMADSWESAMATIRQALQD